MGKVPWQSYIIIVKENRKVGEISKFIFLLITNFISLRDKGRFPRPCHICLAYLFVSSTMHSIMSVGKKCWKVSSGDSEIGTAGPTD